MTQSPLSEPLASQPPHPLPPRGGQWPIADIIMMTDYGTPAQKADTNTAAMNPSKFFLRVHMDVGYNSGDGIEALIQQGHLMLAYSKIVTSNINSGQGTTPRAQAVLAAALGYFDNVAPAPLPVPVPLPAPALAPVP